MEGLDIGLIAFQLFFEPLGVADARVALGEGLHLPGVLPAGGLELPHGAVVRLQGGDLEALAVGTYGVEGLALEPRVLEGALHGLYLAGAHIELVLEL